MAQPQSSGHLQAPLGQGSRQGSSLSISWKLMTTQRLPMEVVSWQWLLILTSRSHQALIQVSSSSPPPRLLPPTTCLMFHVLHVSKNATSNRFQRFPRYPLSPHLPPNRKKKVKNCVDLLQKEKILKLKVEFIFIQFTSDIKRQLHSPLPHPIQDRTRPPLTRCPFLWKLHFYIIQQGQGGQVNGKRRKGNQWKETSVRHSLSQAFFMTLLQRLLLVVVVAVAALTTKVPIKRHKICVARMRTGRERAGEWGRPVRPAMEVATWVVALWMGFKVPRSGLGQIPLKAQMML